ncbi:MAG: MotA/TolQ/ExbB proton channel family protein [Deltaproteobacteria bacterium]|nr:MotA/TolQ/ExbB proton channel family protein [Deltaproteobacteria bacterium]
MDLASLIGSLGVLAVFIFGVAFEKGAFHFEYLQYMWNAPSVIIVMFGTVVATIGSYSIEQIMGLPKSLGRIYKAKSVPLIETLVIIVDVAKVARKNVLAIEDTLPSIENLFLRNGLRLVVDRVDRELITDILMSEMKYAALKKTTDQLVVKQMSVLAPAFGMIGTLIGLILMLQALDDVSSIGPKMAVALITTLYGALLSNGIFLPWATNLDAANKNDNLLNEMIRDGVLFIEKNERAEFIEQDLMNYLTPTLKSKYEELKFSNADKG